MRFTLTSMVYIIALDYTCYWCVVTCYSLWPCQENTTLGFREEEVQHKPWINQVRLILIVAILVTIFCNCPPSTVCCPVIYYSGSPSYFAPTWQFTSGLPRGRMHSGHVKWGCWPFGLWPDLVMFMRMRLHLLWPDLLGFMSMHILSPDLVGLCLLWSDLVWFMHIHLYIFIWQV